ncbi:RDD family protein [Anabaena sp. PCC 7108]|uniref:RDD family protein n=1 Tax=Anabaena sp. PCC 7108 TaxID=163908 RepID=UPI00034552D7|nr:RDD family protein [Anabaena sp. PCC 7108]
MTIVKVPPKHYPKAEIMRRGMALGIDFLGVWLVASLLGSGNSGIQFAQIFVFILTWLVLRVLVVYNNHGQSLGRWAVDLKILELDNNGQIVGRIPQLPALLQREVIICPCSLLLSISLSNIIANPTAILLVLPLAIDCGAALSDTQMRQALHDRYAKTIIVSSRRGYSLDLKIKRLVEKVQRNVRR